MMWSDLGDWWVSEIEADLAYEAVVTPMLIGVLEPAFGHLYLDLGISEGRVIKAVNDCGRPAMDWRDWSRRRITISATGQGCQDSLPAVGGS